MSKFNSPNNDPNQPLIISYLTLRKAVGILGCMLPIVLLIGNMILSQCNEVQDSISNYFYTKMGYVMVGTLCAVGLFMFFFKGYELKDAISSRSACVFVFV